MDCYKMTPSSTQIGAFGGLNIYEALGQISPWGDQLRSDGEIRMGSSVTEVESMVETKIEHLAADRVSNSKQVEESRKSTDKVQRRLAQNREAARKSRQRKKVYVQQLESSRLKLAQLEQELERARQQGIFTGYASDSFHPGYSASGNLGIAMFEMEYSHWVEEQQRQITELRTALQSDSNDLELQILAEGMLNHYNNLFRMKAEAAKVDVFYLISGKWRTSAEQFMQWIGDFRPSEIINVVTPQFNPLTEHQIANIRSLRYSSQQAEDALTQGIDKLQQALTQTIATDIVGDSSNGIQVAAAMDKLEVLEDFMSQADHLRQQTLHQLLRTLTVRQGAQGFLALGEYFYRFRALTTLCSVRFSGIKQ